MALGAQPWFKFYYQDFLLDHNVATLPLEAQAILIRIWSVMGREGTIPFLADPRASPGNKSIRALGVICGIDPDTMERHFEALRSFFIEGGGLLTCPRLAAEHAKSDRISKQRRLSGAMGGRERVRLKANTQANTQAKPRQGKLNIPEEPPEPTQPIAKRVRKNVAIGRPDQAIPEAEDRAAFFRLVKAFPVGKAPNLSQAAQAFQIALDEGAVAPELLECGRRYVASHKLADQRFVTSLHGWLSGRGHLAFLDQVRGLQLSEDPAFQSLIRTDWWY